MHTRSISARGVLAVIVSVEVVAFYLVMRNGSWVYDDNFFLVLAGEDGFTWHWLSSVQFEHWDIGEHVLISLQHRLFFVDYRWGLALMLAFLGGSIVLLERILAMFVRQRWVTLAVAAWFGISVFWARPLQWWAAGVQTFPYTFFDLLCLYGFLRYHAGGGGRWLVASGAALVAAFLFHEKPAYMLVYLALIRVLLMSGDLRPASVLRTAWRERWVWLLYIAIIGTWAVGYLDSGAYVAHASVSAGQYVTFLKTLWLQNLVPSFLGVTIPATNLDASQISFVVLAQVALLAVVVLSLRRRSSAWRAWLFLGTVVVLNGVLVAHSRVPGFGVGIADDPRYMVDIAWLAPLAVCAAFARGEVLSLTPPEPRIELSAVALGAAVPGPSDAPSRERVSARLWVRMPAAILLVLAYLGVSIASAAHLQKLWAGQQARGWETHVRSGIAALQRSGERPVVAENETPFEIMEDFVAPYDRLSRVLPMYVGSIQVDGPLDGTLVRLAEDGTVHRATFVPAPGGPITPIQMLRSHGLLIGAGGRIVREGESACVIADGMPVTLERVVSPALVATDAPFYVRIVYHVPRSVELPISADVGKGLPVPDHAVVLSAASAESIGWVGSGVPRRVVLTLPPLSSVCVDRLELGSLRDTH